MRRGSVDPDNYQHGVKHGDKTRDKRKGVFRRTFHALSKAVRDIVKQKQQPLPPAFPKVLNLGLSAQCQARCIYCPTERGLTMSPSFMSLDLAKSIIDEAQHDGFSGIFRFSENGEALLNKDFFAIFKYFREKLPKAKAYLVTNMGLLTKDKSKELLSLGLDRLNTSIDGASKATFEFATKLNFETVTGNLHDFIENRNHATKHCKISIYILTAHNYMRKVEEKPIDLPDDKEQVIKYWRPHLDEDDIISVVDFPFNWARVKEYPIRKSTPCKKLHECETECFIAPNGDLYLCCFDHQYKWVYGNIVNASLKDLWKSAKRKEAIELLKRMDFQSIGEPCTFCPD